jgi:hypothetical protein
MQTLVGTINTDGWFFSDSRASEVGIVDVVMVIFASLQPVRIWANQSSEQIGQKGS